MKADTGAQPIYYSMDTKNPRDKSGRWQQPSLLASDKVKNERNYTLPFRPYLAPYVFISVSIFSLVEHSFFRRK